jgi:hypothetical protein
MTSLEQPTSKRSPLVNRIMARLLSSPLSWLVDRNVLLLTVNGRRTARPYSFPVQYVQAGMVLWVYVGDETAKTWWRNVWGGAKVQILLRRRIQTGVAFALRHADEPELVQEGLHRYSQRFPRTARRLGIPTDEEQRLGNGASNTVMVRIELTAGGGDRVRSIDGSLVDERARR